MLPAATGGLKILCVSPGRTDPMGGAPSLDQSREFGNQALGYHHHGLTRQLERGFRHRQPPHPQSASRNAPVLFELAVHSSRPEIGFFSSVPAPLPPAVGKEWFTSELERCNHENTWPIATREPSRPGRSSPDSSRPPQSRPRRDSR